jgi:hypothetical protein
VSGSRQKLAALYAQLSHTYAELCRELGGDPSAAAAGSIAPDSDLDGPHGDGQVRFVPKAWKGESFKGRRWSECSPEFLDVLAEAMDYSAANPRQGKERYAKHDARDATRIRGWAARIRSGWKREERNDAPPSGSFNGGDAGTGSFEDNPFNGDDSGTDWDS